jgi:hypothetical protein
VNNLKYTTNAAFAFPLLLTRVNPPLSEDRRSAGGQKEKLQAKGGDADIFNPNFVTGFCDAESCFSINILKNPFYGQNLG